MTTETPCPPNRVKVIAPFGQPQYVVGDVERDAVCRPIESVLYISRVTPVHETMAHR